MQTKRHSVIEVVSNVGSGYFLAMVLNLLFLPLFVVQIANQDILTAALIGLVYMAVSMVRGFGFRRMFNRWAS